jgi:hypothetical protein
MDNTQILNIVRGRIKNEEVPFQIRYKLRHKQTSSFPKREGLKVFESQLESVFEMNPESIEIKLYDPTTGKAEKGSYTITPERQTPSGGLGSIGLSGLEALGGVQQVLGSMIQSESLRERNMDLRGSLDRELSKNEILENKIAELKEKNDDLKDRFYKLQNDLDFQKQRYEAEIDRAKGNAFSAQKLLEITGTVAANVAGIDKDKMLGFLGFADSEETPETKAITESSQSKVEYEPVSQSPAQTHREEINNWMKMIIEKNPSGADYVMKKLYDVVMYIAKSPENLETVHSLIK